MIESFIYAALGGLLIGAASLFMLYFLGRITGISGILWQTLSQPKNIFSWPLLFLVGLVIGGAIAHYVFGLTIPVSPKENPLIIIASGLLVGFGTRLGGGCTSGHGVCGIGRLSPRSIVATITFMAAGIITVSIIRHVIGA